MASPFLASLLIFLSIFCIFNACNIGSASSQGFSMKLMHRDSPLSPLYQASLTSKDRVKAMIDRSLSRAHYLSSIIAGRTSVSASDHRDNGYSGGSVSSISPSPSSPHAQIFPNMGDYLVELEIGTPPVKVMVVADTASDMTWVQCRPCVSCYDQKDPIYDSSKSSTYNVNISCYADVCYTVPGWSCYEGYTCMYEYVYGDGSESKGFMATETLTFSSSHTSFPGIFFGCSIYAQGTFRPTEDGKMGLGGGNWSLVRQLGSSAGAKFSHCLVPFTDNSTTSTLNFGDNAIVKGPGVVTVPMFRNLTDTFYSVNLQSIAVGNNTIYDKSNATNTLIVDSGTTITFIPEAMLEDLIGNMSSRINLKRAVDPSENFELCYAYSIRAPAYPFPDITFNFDKPPRDKAPVVLTPTNTFIFVTDDVICMALQSSRALEGNIAVFGNLAQQNHHMGFDLHNNLLSFAPANCSTF